MTPTIFTYSVKINGHTKQQFTSRQHAVSYVEDYVMDYPDVVWYDGRDYREMLAEGITLNNWTGDGYYYRELISADHQDLICVWRPTSDNRIVFGELDIEIVPNLDNIIATTKTDIGAQIAGIRADRGITQKELAALCDIAQPNLCNIEQGKATTIATIAKIAGTLGYRLALVKD